MKRKLKRSFPRLIENGQIRIINQNILDYRYDKRCYTIFLEVLDNLPHDKVVRNPQSGRYEKMSMVNLKTKEEILVDVKEDKIVSECLDIHLKAEKFKSIHSIGKSTNILDKIAVKIIEKFYLKKEYKD